MPARRYAKKKYNGHSRPGYVRCGKMVISDASKALAMAKYLKSIVNVERKNHDSSGTAVARDTTADIISLTSIAQGDTTVQRDGSQCKLVSLALKYFIEINPSATTTQVRVMIVLDKQTNQLIYGIADLLHDVTADDIIVSPRNLDNMRRFTVLMDRVHTYGALGPTTSYHKFYKKLNIVLRFDNAAAAITSMTENSLSLIFVSNEATNTPVVTHHLRLRFVDN